MTHQHDIDVMIGASDDSQKIAAIRSLAAFTHESWIMDALCEAAVDMASQAVRETLMDVLKTNPAGACMRFSDIVFWSRNPVSRKLALVNMSVLECREAEDAVISGLYDPDASVREAAAMNAGLYGSSDVKKALEQYLQNYRLELTLSLINNRLETTRNRTLPPDEDQDSVVTVLI